jgi:hypothetical protein
MDNQQDQRFDQAVNYIRQYFGQGVPENDIRDAFRQSNWEEELINEAFKFVESPPHVYLQHKTKLAPAPLPPPQYTPPAAAPAQAVNPLQPGSAINPGQVISQTPALSYQKINKSRSRSSRIIFAILLLILLAGAMAAAYLILIKNNSF